VVVINLDPKAKPKTASQKQSLVFLGEYILKKVFWYFGMLHACIKQDSVL
jgi:hypothetical protein